jgi:integrase
MAKTTHRLTAISIKNFKEKGLYSDGNGLYLRITTTGTKGWIFRFALRGRTRDMGLGTTAQLSLAAAREMTEECQKLLKRGIDPIQHREATVEAVSGRAAISFREAAERYVATHEGGWKNPKHRAQWRSTLAEYANPVIGMMDVAAIGTDDVLRVLEPIWQEKPETASRVRGRIEAVLDWARVRGMRDGANPAAWRGHLNHLLPARNKARTVRHHPALPWRELPEFMAELRDNTSISARALEFTILTAARTSETIEAEWSEMNASAAMWIVPKERMKAVREHRVPLSEAAVALLADMPRLDGTPYLFPGGRKGRPLSNMAMLELLRGMRPGLTVHGFRSSFREWAAEATSFPREFAEAALAHIVGNATERAYQRGDLFERRRVLMDAWAAYCGSAPTPAVIPLQRAEG